MTIFSICLLSRMSLHGSKHRRLSYCVYIFRLKQMAFMERFHTIRFDRNGVMELIRVPHPANGDNTANEPILPYGLVKVELTIDDVIQPEGHSEMTSHANTDEGERNPSSQKEGSHLPLLPEEDVLSAILGTVVEAADSVERCDELNTVETGDNSSRNVAVSVLDKVHLLGGGTMIENTFSEMSTRRDKSDERSISLIDKDISTDKTHCAKFNKPNVKVRANYASEADAMASLYPPQGVSGGSSVHGQGFPPGHETGQCSQFEQVAESHNEAARLLNGSALTNNARVLPAEKLTIPQRNKASTVLSSSEQINVHVGGTGDGSTIIPNDDFLSQQLRLTENPGEYEQQPAKHTNTTNGHVAPRTSLPIISLKEISKSSTATSNALSSVGWPRQPSAVFQDKLVQHMSATVASPPALTIAQPVSHAPANTSVHAPPLQYVTHMKDAYNNMTIAAKLASIKVMASNHRQRIGRPRQSTKTPQLPGSTRPLLPAQLQSSTSTPEVAPSAYLVYPNGNVTPLFEVPNKLNVATNPPLKNRQLSASMNVGVNHIPPNIPQLSASPSDEMQPLLSTVFPNPMSMIQGPLSPDLPETSGTISSTTSPTKQRQRKPSAALPLRSAAKTGPIKKTAVYNPGFARTLASRSVRIEVAERSELGEDGNISNNAAKTFRYTGTNSKSSISCAFGKVAPMSKRIGSIPLTKIRDHFHNVNVADENCRKPVGKTSTRRSPVESSVSNALPMADGTPTTEINRPTPSITCGSIYECWRSRAAHIARTLTREIDDRNSRHLPTAKGVCDDRNEGPVAFVPDASPYRPQMPRMFRRPVTQFYDRSAFSEPRNRRNLNSDSVLEETWYRDFYIPGGPGCDWGFRPMAGAPPLFPHDRCPRATTAPTRRYRQPPGERNNSQEHRDTIAIPRPRSSSSNAPVNDDTTLQVSGIDYGSIKRRRDTNEGQYGLSKQHSRNVVRTRTAAARSVRRKRSFPVRKHPVVPERRHFDIRPCSVVITRLDMDKFMLNKCRSDML